MDEFDLATFIANLAARLVGDRATKDEKLEFNWRSPALHHAGGAATNNCVFIDITFQITTMNASFGSLYRSTDNGSTYFTAKMLTQESIQDHFGEEVDTAGTNADVLARSMANELRAGNIRSTDHEIFLCYDGFCGERPVVCRGLDATEIPDKATKLILLGGQHDPAPDGLAEDDIKRITEAIKSKWQNYVEESNKVESVPSPVKEAPEDNATAVGSAESTKASAGLIIPSPEKPPAAASAPQPDSAKKRKPNNKVKSKVKKKKKRTGTLSFVD